MHSFLRFTFRPRLRKWLVAASIVGGVSLAFSGYAEWRVDYAANGRIFSDISAVPVHEVALVLGTSRAIHGVPNPFYEARLDAAAALFRAGKVRGIIVSGDNAAANYNEPRDMKRDLAARGVPEHFITCDYAGLRTLDSVQRVRRVFGQSRVVIVSQYFHLERALYLASAAGLDAVGYVANEAPLSWWLRARAREVLARDLAVIDVAFGREPKHLGDLHIVTLAPTPAGREPMQGVSAGAH